MGINGLSGLRNQVAAIVLENDESYGVCDIHTTVSRAVLEEFVQSGMRNTFSTMYT